MKSLFFLVFNFWFCLEIFEPSSKTVSVTYLSLDRTLILLVYQAQAVTLVEAVAVADLVFWGGRWGTPSHTSVPRQSGIKLGD